MFCALLQYLLYSSLLHLCQGQIPSNNRPKTIHFRHYPESSVFLYLVPLRHIPYCLLPICTKKHHVYTTFLPHTLPLLPSYYTSTPQPHLHPPPHPPSNATSTHVSPASPTWTCASAPSPITSSTQTPTPPPPSTSSPSTNASCKPAATKWSASPSPCAPPNSNASSRSPTGTPAPLCKRLTTPWRKALTWRTARRSTARGGGSCREGRRARGRGRECRRKVARCAGGGGNGRVGT